MIQYDVRVRMEQTGSEREGREDCVQWIDTSSAHRLSGLTEELNEGISPRFTFIVEFDSLLHQHQSPSHSTTDGVKDRDTHSTPWTGPASANT